MSKMLPYATEVEDIRFDVKRLEHTLSLISIEAERADEIEIGAVAAIAQQFIQDSLEPRLRIVQDYLYGHGEVPCEEE